MHQSNSAFNNLLQFLSVKMKNDFFSLSLILYHTFNPIAIKKVAFCNNL
nr:MAG TPA: hypothetical protein [Caudoviricetes sp.]